MKFLTVKELSELLQVKPSTIYAWASRGAIPSCKLNGLLRFEEEEIRRWVENSKAKPSAKIRKIKSNDIRKHDIERIVKRTIETAKMQGYNRSQQKNRTEASPEGGNN